MNRIFLFILSVCWSLLSFGQQSLETTLNRLVNSAYERENVHNVFLRLNSPSKKRTFEFVAGISQDGDTLSNATPFYLASIGKTFTATAIGMLKDQGKLQFDDQINKYLSAEIMTKLHVLETIDYSNEITIAQLLQHTSGLPDYFEDATLDNSPNMINLLFATPTRNWKPKELIQFSKEKMKPLFAPGKGYHYTDTEYVLLGLIIEKISGLALHDFFKQYIFQPLQLQHTYMNLRSAPIAETPKMAEIYVSSYEVSGFQSLSADWAGGGIVSTTNDLIRFQKALFAGKLVHKETFKAMQQWTPETLGMYYGFGLRKVVLNELSAEFPKLTLIGHSGSTASFLYYCPELDVYITGTLNQIEASKDALILVANILSAIEKK
ncbi:MAG: serine hydrolase domain-containing protein [Bacteroidota bacterium]